MSIAVVDEVDAFLASTPPPEMIREKLHSLRVAEETLKVALRLAQKTDATKARAPREGVSRGS
jgi:hypothetical protein